MKANPVIRKGSKVRGSGLIRYIAEGLKLDVPRKARGKLYCGDAGWCSRKSALLSLYDGRNMSNAASMMYMNLGTSVHRTIQEGLKKSGVLIADEKRLDVNIDGISISGMIDGVLDLDGEETILEIKTCGALPSKPKKEHLHQAIVYSLLTGIRSIIVFYFSRSVASYDGTLIAKEFEIRATPDELKEVANILAQSIVATQLKIIPEIPSHITSASSCGFCPFQSRCWTDGEKFKSPPKRFYQKVEEVETLIRKRFKKMSKGVSNE